MNNNSVPLSQVAAVIRSKNAGPFLLTFDILFDDVQSFDCVWDSGSFTKKNIARQFGIIEEKVLSIFSIRSGRAIKFTLRRPQPQGSVGETDMYGCQQHAPLLDFPVYMVKG